MKNLKKSNRKQKTSLLGILLLSLILTSLVNAKVVPYEDMDGYYIVSESDLRDIYELKKQNEFYLKEIDRLNNKKDWKAKAGLSTIKAFYVELELELF